MDDLHWAFSRALLKALKLFLGSQPATEPRTIVVLRNCFFGDFIVAVPALRAIREAFPAARIVFLTATSFAPGLRDRPQAVGVYDIEPGLIDSVVRYASQDLSDARERAALIARIDSRGPTVTLALCYSADGLRSRLKRIAVSRMLSLPFPLGLTGPRTLPAQHAFNRWRVGRSDIVHQTEGALMSAQELLLGRVSSSPRQVTAPDRSRAAKPHIGVAPFTKQRVKQWPIARFAEVMAALADETGASFEIYGAPNERDQAAELDGLLPASIEVKQMCGTLSPLELRRRIEQIDLLLCLDSGPMHLASLVNTPVVAIFSQITLHNFWRPWGAVSALISVPVPCAQCDARDDVCPAGTRACIDGIGVEAVLNRVRPMLAQSVHRSHRLSA